MNNTHCENIVVDACVARSSGDFNAPSDVARVCRDILLCIYHNNHKLVWTPLIRGEWRIQSSNFAREWRTNMARAGKIHILNPHPVKSQIWGLIFGNPLFSAQSITIMEKDFMYIEAALNSDKCILSRDDEARTEFINASRIVDEIKTIIWLNPCKPQESVFDWIHHGAMYESSRTLEKM